MDARDRACGALAPAFGAATPRCHCPHEEPDAQQDERRLDVVGRLDLQREIRLGQEEVEGQRRHERGDGAGTTTTDDRGRHHHEDEDQREVGAVDLRTHRYQQQRHHDRSERGDGQPDEPVDPIVVRARHRTHHPATGRRKPAR
jgi:hypothetical protein